MRWRLRKRNRKRKVLKEKKANNNATVREPKEAKVQKQKVMVN